MPRQSPARAVAALALGALATLSAVAAPPPPPPDLPPAQQAAGDAAGDAALETDDQCAAGDDGCALSALQLRRARLAASASEAARGGPADGEPPLEEALLQAENDEDALVGGSPAPTNGDLTELQSAKMESMLYQIGNYTTIMEDKIQDMDEDLKSLNATLFGIKDHPVGVNGTEVDWSAHPAWWIPSLAHTTVGGEDGESSEAGEALALAEGLAGHGRRRHRRKASAQSDPGAETPTTVPLPPRLKQLRTDMADQQERIDLVGESLPILGRNMDWVAHWMGNHRRLKNGVPVLLEEDPSVKAMSSRPHRSVAVDEATQVKKHVYKSIQRAREQQGEFWKQFSSLGGRLQGLKRRVKLYLAAGLLQDTQREEVEAMAADEAIPAAVQAMAA